MCAKLVRTLRAKLCRTIWAKLRRTLCAKLCRAKGRAIGHTMRAEFGRTRCARLYSAWCTELCRTMLRAKLGRTRCAKLGRTLCAMLGRTMCAKSKPHRACKVRPHNVCQVVPPFVRKIYAAHWVQRVSRTGHAKLHRTMCDEFGRTLRAKLCRTMRAFQPSSCNKEPDRRQGRHNPPATLRQVHPSALGRKDTAVAGDPLCKGEAEEWSGSRKIPHGCQSGGRSSDSRRIPDP
jgi:hypothetical protein